MTVVGAIQLAHVPILPGAIAAQNGDPLPPECESALRAMAPDFVADGHHLRAMRERFCDFAPDVVVFFDSDHLNTFFIDHAPSVAVGVDDVTSGPSDHPIGHPAYPRIPLHRELGDAIHRGLVASDFDAARVQRFTLDHSITVPLHFLTPDMDVPLVPVWVNGLHGVPIRSARARALGHAVREIVDAACPHQRVLLLSSGAISLDIGTPRIMPGNVFGVPEPEWVSEATTYIARGNLDALVEQATPERFVQSGNASAELLNIIAVMAALGEESCTPVFVEQVARFGHIYAIWDPE